MSLLYNLGVDKDALTPCTDAWEREKDDRGRGGVCCGSAGVILASVDVNLSSLDVNPLSLDDLIGIAQKWCPPYVHIT